MSRAVLSNIQVLTANTRMEQQKKDNQPIAADSRDVARHAPGRRKARACDGRRQRHAGDLRNPLDTDETKTCWSTHGEPDVIA